MSVIVGVFYNLVYVWGYLREWGEEVEVEIGSCFILIWKYKS